MHSKTILLFLIIFLALPVVNAQAVVSFHNITYELRAGDVFVIESILFLNPDESEIHTFDDTVTLLRGEVNSLEVSGVVWRLNNETTPNIIQLDFSNNPIIATATKNSRTVVLTYVTRDFIDETVFDNRVRINTFSGNVLLPTPTELEVGDTRISIKAASGYQLGTVLPQTESINNEVAYLMSRADRKVFTAFVVEIQYARFEDYAHENIKLIQNRVKDVKSRVENANSSILNAEVYDANLSRAHASLNVATTLLSSVQGNLSIADAFLTHGSFYISFLLTNASMRVVEAAEKSAIDAETEANFQLRRALNEKISRLENLTSTINISSPAPINVSEPGAVINGTPKTTPSASPTLTPLPPAGADGSPQKSGSRTIVYAAALIIIMLILATLYFGKGKDKKNRQAAVKDFRSIADLKRKSYKDFEEKLIDVKKETSIAGELRTFGMAKKKFELGVDNLEKKKLAGEIDENIYNTEKKNYESSIKELDDKIKTLEKELSKKGGSNGKGKPDRSKIGR